MLIAFGNMDLTQVKTCHPQFPFGRISKQLPSAYTGPMRRMVNEPFAPNHEETGYVEQRCDPFKHAVFQF